MHVVQTQRPVNRLRELRQAKGLKLYDLAAELRVDPSTISRWETKGSIPDEYKPALAELLEVSIAYLMRWENGDASADHSPSNGKAAAA